MSFAVKDKNKIKLLRKCAQILTQESETLSIHFSKTKVSLNQALRPSPVDSIFHTKQWRWDIVLWLLCILVQQVYPSRCGDGRRRRHSAGDMPSQHVPRDIQYYRWLGAGIHDHLTGQQQRWIESHKDKRLHAYRGDLGVLSWRRGHLWWCIRIPRQSITD